MVNVLKQHVAQYSEKLLYVTCDGVQYTLRDFYQLCVQSKRLFVALMLQPLGDVSMHRFKSVHWFEASVRAIIAMCITAVSKPPKMPT